MDATRLPDTPTPAWRCWLVAVALLPVSVNIGPYVMPKGKELNLAPLDLLITPLMLLVLWDLWKRRDRSLLPPLPNAAWAALALASLLWVSGIGKVEWARSAIGQTVLVGLCAVWAFRGLVPGVLAYRKLTLVLGALLSLCFLYALYQYIQPRGVPLPSEVTGRYHGGGVTDIRVGGWFDVRAELAAHVAMIVPAAAAFVALERDVMVRVFAGALGLVALCVCLYGGGVLAAGAGVLVVAGALWILPSNPPGSPHARWWALWLVVGLFFVTMAVLPRLPRGNDRVLAETLTPWVKEADGKEVASVRLRRTQVAALLLADRQRWRTGVGSGGYRLHIKHYYNDSGAYPTPGAARDEEAQFDRDTHEPGSFSLLETTAVELGLPGLIFMAWALCAWLAAAAWAFARSSDPTVRLLALAALGAGVGATVFSLFGNPLVRGVGCSWAFFMGLALALPVRAVAREGTRDES